MYIEQQTVTGDGYQITDAWGGAVVFYRVRPLYVIKKYM